MILELEPRLRLRILRDAFVRRQVKLFPTGQSRSLRDRLTAAKVVTFITPRAFGNRNIRGDLLWNTRSTAT